MSIHVVADICKQEARVNVCLHMVLQTSVSRRQGLIMSIHVVADICKQEARVNVCLDVPMHSCIE